MTGILSRLASLIASASLLVSMTNTRSGMPPMSLMPPSAFSSFSCSRDSIRRSFLVRPLAPSPSISSSLRSRVIEAEMVFQLVSMPPSQRELTKYCAAALGRFGDLGGRLALGADEQHAPALGDGVGDGLQRLVQQRHGLREIDDVDGVAGAVDVGRHLGVPAMRLVAEMRARFEELAHGEIRQSHCVSFPVEPRRIDEARKPRHRSEPLKQGPRKSACGMGGVNTGGWGERQGRGEFVAPPRHFDASGAESCPNDNSSAGVGRLCRRSGSISRRDLLPRRPCLEERRLTYLASPSRYDAMIYNRCGRTGLRLPAISLGLWHNFGADKPADAGRAICRRAFDLGITHFDLANNYGPPPGSAEIAFGEHSSRRLSRPTRRTRHLDQGRLSTCGRAPMANGVAANTCWPASTRA